MNNGTDPQIPTHPSGDALSQEAGHVMWSNVDLGEFMMDNDLDFLGRIFNFNHSHEMGI